MSDIPQVVGGCVLAELYEASKAILQFQLQDIPAKHFLRLNAALEKAERTLYPLGSPASTHELASELEAAGDIIRIALNTMQGEQKTAFIQNVCKAGLDGEGVTRGHERAALLARVKEFRS